MRVSNFLLWQIAYAEIWVTETLWPDFRCRHLLEAIVDFQKRERRYGGIGVATRSRRAARRLPPPTSCRDEVAADAHPHAAAVLLPIVVGIVWYLPPAATLG